MFLDISMYIYVCKYICIYTYACITKYVLCTVISSPEFIPREDNQQKPHIELKKLQQLSSPEFIPTEDNQQSLFLGNIINRVYS